MDMHHEHLANVADWDIRAKEIGSFSARGAKDERRDRGEHSYHGCHGNPLKPARGHRLNIMTTTQKTLDEYGKCRDTLKGQMLDCANVLQNEKPVKDPPLLPVESTIRARG
jgi:hypothetical protein